jgi:hypothetical protein
MRCRNDWITAKPAVQSWLPAVTASWQMARFAPMLELTLRARAGADSVSQIVSQPACQVRDLGAARPPGRILGDQLHHQGAHVGRHRRGQRRYRAVAVRARYVQWLARERGCPGQAFVRDDSQRVQITGRGGLSPGYPLRRQVPRGSHHDPGGRDGHRADRTRDAEIGDLHGSVRGEQEVPRLDITVDQARGVRGLQPGRGLRDDVHGPPGIQRAAGEHASQTGPVDQLHDQIGPCAIGGLVVVINVRDVHVPHGRGAPRLGPEPGQGLWLPGVARIQQLDRDRPRQDGIRRAPYLAKPAYADRLIKPITTGEEGSGEGHQPVVTLISGPLPALDARCLWPSAVNYLPAGQPPVTPRSTQNSLAPGDPVLHLRELGYPRERQGYPTSGAISTPSESSG